MLFIVTAFLMILISSDVLLNSMVSNILIFISISLIFLAFLLVLSHGVKKRFLLDITQRP